MTRIVEKVTVLVEPVINDIGYELLGIEYISSYSKNILRLYIDSVKGISVNDCELASKQVSSILDVESLIDCRYDLEVSSPGIARPLFKVKHYQRFLGYDVKLRLVRALDGQRKFKGTILSIREKDNIIELATELKTVELDFNMIEKANLVAIF